MEATVQSRSKVSDPLSLEEEAYPLKIFARSLDQSRD